MKLRVRVEVEYDRGTDDADEAQVVGWEYDRLRTSHDDLVDAVRAGKVVGLVVTPA